MVAGNWKMNASMNMLEVLLGELRGIDAPERDVVVCPPFPYIVTAAGKLTGSQVVVGGQDCAATVAGAYTGEVAASMLADCGCQYVILGHSERRSLFGDTADIILEKVRQALAVGLKVIFCVGESLSERQAGQEEAVVASQLASLLSDLSDGEWRSVIVAYEPVWAIGTGETATPEQAQAMHAFIRSCLAGRSAGIAQETRILYGGSVKADNASELFAQPDIDGGLVGGASLDAAQFIAICMA